MPYPNEYPMWSGTYALSCAVGVGEAVDGSAIGTTQAPPIDRARLTAHIVATLPLLSDAALAHLSAHVDTLETRPLDAAALARMQREREGACELATT